MYPMLVGHVEDSILRRLVVFGVNAILFLAGGVVTATLLGAIGLFSAAMIGGDYLNAYLFVIWLYGFRSGTRSLGAAMEGQSIRHFWKLSTELLQQIHEQTAIEPATEEQMDGPAPLPLTPGPGTDEGELAEARQKVTEGILVVTLALTYITVFFSSVAAVMAYGTAFFSQGVAFLLGVVLFLVEVYSLDSFGRGPVSGLLDSLWDMFVDNGDTAHIRDLPYIGRDSR
ncbi:hypothetical protein ACOJIV_18030 [Haloarcula sp. AONF1]